MQAYWTDPLYCQTICARVPNSISHHITQGGFPVLCTQNGDKPKHLAVAPGFLSPASIEEFNQFLSDILTIAKSENITSAYLQFRGDDKPGLENILQQKCTGFHIDEKICIHINTGMDDDALMQSCRRNTRRGLNEIMEGGLNAKDEYNPKFMEYYREISKKNNFAQAYRYTDEDLQNIIAAKNIFPVSVYDDKGAYIGGAILGKVDDTICDTIIHAYDPELSNASRAILWETSRKTRDLGCSINNLGGGVARDDALHQYKLSFGGHEHPFYSIKIMLNSEAFNAAYGPPNWTGRFPA